MRRVLPEKYRNLNESNIHTAKIYMRDLIGNDDNHIIKGMVDFKRAFGRRSVGPFQLFGSHQRRRNNRIYSNKEENLCGNRC